MDLSSIVNLVLGFAGVDIAGQVAAFADSFAYSLVLWLYNIALWQGLL